MKDKHSATPAVHVLREHGAAFTHHPYDYEERGGTSPFGTRRTMPAYMERGIAALPYLYVNGGRRGHLVGMAPADLIRVLKPILADIATDQGD